MRNVGSFIRTSLEKIDERFRNLPADEVGGFGYTDTLQCFGCHSQKYNVLQVWEAMWLCIECLATLIGSGRLIVRPVTEEAPVFHEDGTAEVGDITVAWK